MSPVEYSRQIALLAISQNISELPDVLEAKHELHTLLHSVDPPDEAVMRALELSTRALALVMATWQKDSIENVKLKGMVNRMTRIRNFQG